MTEKQKVRLNTEMSKNESEDTHPMSSSDNFSSLSSSGLLRKTESVRGTVLSRKAMNLGTIESVSSDDDWGLGGIGESSNTQFHLYFNHRMTGHPWTQQGSLPGTSKQSTGLFFRIPVLPCAHQTPPGFWMFAQFAGMTLKERSVKKMEENRE